VKRSQLNAKTSTCVAIGLKDEVYIVSQKKMPPFCIFVIT